MKIALAPLALLLASNVFGGETREVQPKTYYRTYSASHPVLARIRPGDTIRTKTLDAGGRDEKYEVRHRDNIGLTGPFYIEGAEPGDAIAITLKRVHPNRELGYTTNRLLLNAVLPEYVEKIYSSEYKDALVRPGRANLLPWKVDMKRRVATLSEPISTRVKLELPVQPMLGSIGVASSLDSAPTSKISGPYGGNIDYNRIGEGATVLLPVFHPGALLFFGDGHALQGDAEPTGTGIEISLDVEFVASIRKKAALSGPRVETAEFLISLGSQPEFASDLNRSFQMATTDMIHWLVDSYKLEPMAAHLLIGYTGQYDVATVAGTIALRIPRRRLEEGGFR